MSGRRIDAIAGVRLAGPGAERAATTGPHDVLLADGRIVDIAPSGALRLTGEVLQGDGAFLVPGLWDHHVHVGQAALTALRVDLGDVATAAEAAAVMADALVGPDGRRVGAGFRDAFWPDAPSLAVLDERTGVVPTYLVNADLHSLWLNSAALSREGMTSPDGVLREEAAFEVSRRLGSVPAELVDAAVADLARRAASRGVVGLVDLDMAENESVWQRRRAGGFDTLRVRFGIYPEHVDRALAAGLVTGDPLRGDTGDLVHVGPVKVITDGSLGTRTAACSVAYPGDPHDHGLLAVGPEELRDLLIRATGGGLAAAVHAIGDDAVRHALDAFALTGATGTIEHAQLVAAADIPRFARLDVAASVQPAHALDDRDLTDALWAAQTAIAYPLRSLADGGAALLFGSDAPVSTLDPWAAIAAAVHRTRDGREPWRPGEAVPIALALAASTAGGSLRPSEITPGAVADMVLTGADPATAGEETLRQMPVTATLLGGRMTYGG